MTSSRIGPRDQGDPTLGQDGGAEEDREYQDPSATVVRT
jgi:hypothetical protein